MDTKGPAKLVPNEESKSQMGSARVSLNGQEAQETHFLRLVLSLLFWEWPHPSRVYSQLGIGKSLNQEIKGIQKGPKSCVKNGPKLCDNKIK